MPSSSTHVSPLSVVVDKLRQLNPKPRKQSTKSSSAKDTLWATSKGDPPWLRNAQRRYMALHPSLTSSEPVPMPAPVIMNVPHQLGPNLFTGFPEYSPEWIAPNGRPYTHTIDVMADDDCLPDILTSYCGSENFMRLYTSLSLKGEGTRLSRQQIAAAKYLLMLAPQPDPYADTSVPCVFIRGAPADVMSIAVLYLAMLSKQSPAKLLGAINAQPKINACWKGVVSQRALALIDQVLAP
ncbi:hypothetical protein HWV62_39563 [Athelia sp. TMB]|nr:hypothetical protein HWV62_39563 [Athelia sp. TMB]